MDDGQHIFYWWRTQGKKYLVAAPFRKNEMVIWMETQGECFLLFCLNPGLVFLKSLYFIDIQKHLRLHLTAKLKTSSGTTFYGKVIPFFFTISAFFRKMIKNLLQWKLKRLKLKETQAMKILNGIISIRKNLGKVSLNKTMFTFSRSDPLPSPAFCTAFSCFAYLPTVDGSTSVSLMHFTNSLQ